MMRHYDIEQDLYELRHMASYLEGYIQSDNMYGYNQGIFESLPPLTVGTVLFRSRRLTSLRDTLGQQNRKILTTTLHTIEDIYQRWRVRYNVKIVSEFKSRVSASHSYFQGCKQSPRLCLMRYQTQLLQRTLLQELMHGMRQVEMNPSGIQGLLVPIDTAQRELTKPSAFQWDSVLQPVYQMEEYWWLYRQPDKETSNQSVNQWQERT